MSLNAKKKNTITCILETVVQMMTLFQWTEVTIRSYHPTTRKVIWLDVEQTNPRSEISKK